MSTRAYNNGNGAPLPDAYGFHHALGHEDSGAVVKHFSAFENRSLTGYVPSITADADPAYKPKDMSSNSNSMDNTKPWPSCPPATILKQETYSNNTAVKTAPSTIKHAKNWNGNLSTTEPKNFRCLLLRRWRGRVKR